MEASQVLEAMLPTVAKEESALIEIESARAVQEVQAAVIMAKRFPRDQTAAFKRIKEACKRPSLAKEAMYAYPRGGTLVTGPSIRLAEVLAQNWGNMQSGIRELSQRITPNGGVSEVQAFAWDLETNNLQSKTFQVEHVRYTRKEGKKRLVDPRDIYEMIANQGARRLRACILSVIPGDIVEEAVNQCEKTMEKGDERPLAERIRDMVLAFDILGVTQEQIEKRLGHKVDATIATELVTLGKIYRSLKDGMSKVEDFFDIAREERQETADLQSKLDATKPPPIKWMCEYCEFEAISERGLKKHMTQQHAHAEKAPSEPSEPSEGDSTSPPEIDGSELPSEATEPEEMPPHMTEPPAEDEAWFVTYKNTFARERSSLAYALGSVRKSDTAVNEILEKILPSGVTFDDIAAEPDGKNIAEQIIYEMREAAKQ